jgi:hypothetical protein
MGRLEPAGSGIFSSGPWRPEDGDPNQPETVHGVPVVERLGQDPDGRGALVRLADRRYALTGATVVIAPARKLVQHLRRRRRDLIGERWARQARELLQRDVSRSSAGR